MISVSPVCASALDMGARTAVVVGSSLPGGVLADVVPVESLTETVDRTLAVPEKITVTVPRVDDTGMSWDPGGVAAHPLAPWGQVLSVDVAVDVGGDIELIRRGRYLVVETEVDGDVVTVTALGLLAYLDVDLEKPLTSRERCSGTFADLVGGALPIDAAVGLPDPRCPVKTWDSRRLDAALDVVDAWGVEATVTAAGRVAVTAVADPAAVAGTVRATGVTSRLDRGDAVTMVVARGQTSTGVAVRAVALDTDPASPLRHGGPLSPVPVPHIYESSLLTTEAQCRAAAARVLARLRQRPVTQTIRVDAVPDPRVQVGDLWDVELGGVVVARGVVEAMSAPWTAAGGAMSLSMRVV